MPTIDSNLVPTVNPGNLFSRFSSDSSLNIRWLTANDPVYFEVLNRPMADIALRQLVMARTLDNVNLRISHQANFPFLTTAQITTGSTVIDLPLSWIWDMHVSLPAKWELVRLISVKRISGANSGSEFTGKLRLTFGGQQEGSSSEVALFYADFDINSILTYQLVRITVPTSAEESNAIDSSESETVDGFIIFRTLDLEDTEVQTFYSFVEPPLVTDDLDSDGLFDSPSVYETVAESAGSSAIDNDFSLLGLDHGTGLVVSSAVNPIPSLDSDVATWINTFNYPFDAEATRISASNPGITIPAGLFREFSITAPSPDQPTGDTSGDNYPVYISRIERIGDSADSLQFFFATYKVDASSTAAVEFASLTIPSDATPDTIIEIVPESSLFSDDNATDTSFYQGFGTGHVVLSALWGGTSTVVDDFYSLFVSIVATPPAASFSQSATRLSSFGVHRSSENTPTDGQADALRGTLGTNTTPVNPSATNRFVVEGDEGSGELVDFNEEAGINAHDGVDRYGNKLTRVHALVKLSVDASDNTLVYNDDILPRLRILFGRDPVFGDQWFDGTRFKTFDGNNWIG